MNKAKYILIVGIAAFSLVLFGARSYAQYSPWIEGNLQGGGTRGWDNFPASWFIGHQVFSPVSVMYDGNLGQVSDLLIDKGCAGRIAFVILSDTPGFGSNYLAVPFESLKRTGENTFELSFAGMDVWEPYDRYTTSGDRYAQFLARNSATVGFTTLSAAIDPMWADGVYRFFDITPYWAKGTQPDIVSYRETKMLGAEVRSQDGRMSGRIDDLVINYPDGRVAFVVFDNVPGRGDAEIAAPFAELSMSGNAYVLNVEGDKFASAPAFSAFDFSGRSAEIYSFYGVSPSWTPCEPSCGGGAENFQGMASPALPSDAKPGECYAKFFVAPRCETVTEQVMVRPASERVEEIPAKYETVQESVMVQPASKRTEEIPAEYKTVQEQVLVEPAHTEWKAGRGAVEKMDSATGEIMCLVEIPAMYKTVEKQVLVKPATTREFEIPAKYEMRNVTRMTEPAREEHIQIPAEYQTVTRTQKVADGYFEWRKVEGCQVGK